MSDVGLCFDGEGFDIFVRNGDLVGDEGLETAVVISLFTDKRVTAQELPQLETDQRGWWADNIAEIETDQIGSKLWLLDREKVTDELLAAAESYATDALSWLIEDAIASTVVPTADVVDGELQLDIEITRPQDVDVRLSFLWDGQELKRVA